MVKNTLLPIEKPAQARASPLAPEVLNPHACLGKAPLADGWLERLLQNFPGISR